MKRLVKAQAPMPLKKHEGVVQIVDRLLDRGVVINAKTRVYLAELKLIEIEALLVLANFETAYRLGIGLPKDIDLNAKAWRELILKEACPQCGKGIARGELFLRCPWCGYGAGGYND